MSQSSCYYSGAVTAALFYLEHNMTNQIIDIARECINKGLSPIPIPYQSKRPIHPDWPKLRINGR